MQQSKVSIKYSEENSVYGRVSYNLLYIGVSVGGSGVGWALIRGWALINFFCLRMGAYSRLALIRGWALNRINAVNKSALPTIEKLSTVDSR